VGGVVEINNFLCDQNSNMMNRRKELFELAAKYGVKATTKDPSYRIEQRIQAAAAASLPPTLDEPPGASMNLKKISSMIQSPATPKTIPIGPIGPMDAPQILKQPEQLDLAETLVNDVLKDGPSTAKKSDEVPSSIRLGAAEALLALEPQYCDFNYLKIFKHNAKNSFSTTSVLFGEIGPSKVSMKITYHWDRPNDNSLVYERIAYKVVMNNLIKMSWSPHLIAYIGSFSCGLHDFMNNKSITREYKVDILADLIAGFANHDSVEPTDQIFAEMMFADDKLMKSKHPFADVMKMANIEPRPNKPSVDKLDFLVTEMAHTAKSLQKWLSEETHTIEELVAVFFQVLYTFEVFNRIGFRHNDSHCGNIFIEDWSDVEGVPEYTTYNVDGEFYRIPTRRNFVKIYDFDRGYFNCDPNNINEQYKWLIEEFERNVKGCTNTFLKDWPCEQYSQCNKLCPKFDTVNTLKNAHQHIDSRRREKMFPMDDALKQLDRFILNQTKNIPKENFMVDIQNKSRRSRYLDCNKTLRDAHMKPTIEVMKDLLALSKDVLKVEPPPGAAVVYSLPFPPSKNN
jgi:hypothetical protein